MKITVEIPDEWGQQLDFAASLDGHTNRAAVIRKALKVFFAEKSHFVSLPKNEKKEYQSPNESMNSRHEQNNDTN